MRRYRKKPVEVVAVQWTGSNEAEIKKFVGARENGECRFLLPGEITGAWEHPRVYDELHDTWVTVYEGQWVIKGVKGEFYPVAADVFAETYEPLHKPEITNHPGYERWCATGERIRAELGATNANHASWIPHPFAGEGLPVCAACEQPERSEIHWHNCTESGCGAAVRKTEGRT